MSDESVATAVVKKFKVIHGREHLANELVPVKGTYRCKKERSRRADKIASTCLSRSIREEATEHRDGYFESVTLCTMNVTGIEPDVEMNRKGETAEKFQRKDQAGLRPVWMEIALKYWIRKKVQAV